MLIESPLTVSEFYYTLPDERIAKFPLSRRDESKLLVWQNDTISHLQFYQLPNTLPNGAVLVFNNTKVIPARLYFHRMTGAEIEILLIQPYQTTMEQALSAQESCVWLCEIGNLRKWKHDETLSDGHLAVSLLDRAEKLVQFEWENGLSFVENLQRCGDIPIPPYLRREATIEDKKNYQTIYAKREGAIAAPTAGLHFTKEIFDKLSEKKITTTEITLHVGAGTFKPIKTHDPTDHDMHTEIISISRASIESLLQAERIITVGTTSLRTLESLYWYAVKLTTSTDTSFSIPKLYPYTFSELPITRYEALSSLLDYMSEKNISILNGETSLLIVPGYEFAFSDALITNFHQSGSTLILLIAAYIGQSWKTIYDSALGNEYRFLSYGDSSIIFRNTPSDKK